VKRGDGAADDIAASIGIAIGSTPAKTPEIETRLINRNSDNRNVALNSFDDEA
jgi:hypothetical protein